MNTLINDARAALLAFLKWKNAQIKKYIGGIHYITSRDLDEIEYTWDLPLCALVWRRMLENIRISEREWVTILADSATCPWCIQKQLSIKGSCITCNYGSRNGICVRNKHSRYTQIFEQATDITNLGRPVVSINTLIGMHYIKNTILDLDKELHQSRKSN